MTHPKLVAVLAAMLFVGSAGTALAQGTGGARAPSPGIGGGGIGGGGGTFIAPSPGIGTGASPGTGITPTPGIGTGTPSNITPTPGIGTTPNPAGTLTGGPPSGGPPGERSSSDKPPNLGPARTLADIKEETEAGITYQPCPLTSDFRTASRCALVFRDFPLIGHTTRRNSASPPSDWRSSSLTAPMTFLMRIDTGCIYSSRDSRRRRRDWPMPEIFPDVSGRRGDHPKDRTVPRET